MGAHVGIVAIVLAATLFREQSRPLLSWLGKHALWLILFVTLGSVVGSLIYSEVVGYPACSLCWWGRIFLYPQLVIVGVALWKKRHDVDVYLWPLTVLGAIVALYNVYIQYGGKEFFACASTEVSCAQRFVFEFGYITIPMMALTSFALIALLLWLQKDGGESEHNAHH